MPVALSGLDCLEVEVNGCSKRILLIINVIPDGDGTDFLVSTSTEDSGFIESYLDRISTGLTMLNTIEAAMLHSTDHWFIRPSVWNGLPELRKRSILSALGRSIHQNSLCWIPYSIFDEVRTSILNDLSDAIQESKQTPGQIEFFAGESRKISRDR